MLELRGFENFRNGIDNSILDQGTYGMMQKPPPVYKIKERKPKVYSSYAVDNPNCTVHSKNLKKQVQQTSLINLSS